MYDLIVIGGGIAGYTAAIYAARYMIKSLVIEKKPGGIILDTPVVENYPGFKSITGKELMKKVKKQVLGLGVEIVKGDVDAVRKDGNEFSVRVDDKNFKSKSLIIAVGTKKRKINVPGEEEFKGKGVSYCATCDAAFFKNKVVAVIGGGNSAFRTAQILLEHVKKLYMIDIAEELWVEPFLLNQLKDNPKLTIMSSTGLKEIRGDNKVKAIVTSKDKELEVDGVFVDIGFIPPKEISEQLNLETDKFGYIKVDEAMKTNIKGVFAAGDITNASDNFRQLTTAAAEGSIAANSVFNYVKSLK